MVGEAFRPPSGTYLCGTDDVGRNVFHQVVVGAQTSVMVGLIAAAFSTTIGLIVGSVSGHYGRWLDAFLMRGTELFMVIPRGFLALVMVAIMGASIWNIIFAIGVLSWPSTARLVRSEFLRFKHSEFVDAARASGAPERRIMVYEILPNAFPTIIVNTALEVGSAILLEAGISFLGLGDPQQMSWGVMLFQAQNLYAPGSLDDHLSGGGDFFDGDGAEPLCGWIERGIEPEIPADHQTESGRVRAND